MLCDLSFCAYTVYMLNNTATNTELSSLARTPRPSRATLLGRVGVWDVYTVLTDDSEQGFLSINTENKVKRPMSFVHARIFAGRTNGSEFWAACLALVDANYVALGQRTRPSYVSSRREVVNNVPRGMTLVREHLRRLPSR